MAEENGGWSRSLSAMENESSNHHCPYSGCGALRTFRNVCAFFLCMAVSPLSFLIFVRKPDFSNDVDEAFAASMPTGFLQENLIGPNQLPGHLFHAFCFVPGNLLYPDYKTHKDKNALQIVYIPCRFFPGNHRRQKLRQKTGSSASVFSQMAWFYAHFSGRHTSFFRAGQTQKADGAFPPSAPPCTAIESGCPIHIRPAWDVLSRSF